MKIISRPVKNFIKYRILHVEDSPHRIALGVGLGFFVAYMPFLGFHLILVLLLSWIFKANKAVAFLCSWLCNPLTIGMIYFPCYLLGRLVMGLIRQVPPVQNPEIVGKLESMFTLRQIFSGFFTAQFWADLGSLAAKVGVEMLVGGFILGGAVGTAGYFLAYRILVWYRNKHPHLNLQR